MGEEGRELGDGRSHGGEMGSKGGVGGGELRRGSPVERATNASSSPRPVAARATSLRPAPVSRAEAAAVATRHRARDPVRARTARRAGPSGDADVAVMAEATL